MKVSVETIERIADVIHSKEMYSKWDVVNIVRGLMNNSYWNTYEPIDIIRMVAYAIILKSKDNHAKFSNTVAELTESPELLIARKGNSYQDWSGMVYGTDHQLFYVKHAFFTIRYSGYIDWKAGQLRNASGAWYGQNMYLVSRDKNN